MNGSRMEFGAPWGKMLTIMSAGVVLLFLVITGAAYREDGEVWALLFPLLLLLAVPFIVRGYVVENGSLVIRRMGWSTRFPLDDLESVEIDPHAMRGSIRVFGNGGLFSFTGLYRNRKLGNYRAFVNDLNRMVVLRFAKRTIVVSPNDPDGFAEAIKGSTAKEDVT